MLKAFAAIGQVLSASTKLCGKCEADKRSRAQTGRGAGEARPDRLLADAVPHIVFTADREGQVDYCNRAWFDYTGLTEGATYAGDWHAVLQADDTPGRLATWLDIMKNGPQRETQLRIRRASDGTYRWFAARTTPVHDATGAAVKWIGSCVDIHDLKLASERRSASDVATDSEARKSAEAALAESVAELTHRAHHDPLTSLPNRTKLIEQLGRMICEAERDETNVVVLYLDVDHFKTVNDTLGHEAGDQLLVEIACRINANLRAEDTASRLGGDEFVLVCTADGVVDAANVAERLQSAVRAPIELNGKRVVVASSIGISMFPQDGSTPAELMRKADEAMYEAKESGRDAWCFYRARGTSPAVPALDLELELREAIAREQFVVYFQPIIDIESRRAIGAEALVRWMHPQRGLLAPGQFIAFAENHGMIAQIGDFVLNAACAQLARLNLRASDDFSIAVNVSAHQFARPSFVGLIATAIDAHGIDPRRLEIEITESVVMADTAAVIATLERLKALGVRLSIDDFGTGYSSLAYIKNFPIHTLKIDRSFVTDIARNFTDQAIAKTIVTLAHSLGMRTIAEGVETVDQLERLRAFGADCFQGFLVSRPLPSEQFEAFLSGRSSSLKRLV